MSKRTLMVLAAAAFCTLLLAGVALAMSSDNYRLEWFTPLTGGGGGPASSAHYAVNLTVGQSAIGPSASTNHGGCLGYWCSGAVPYKVYLPLVFRGY
jgi:hypothetical protein